MTEVELRDFLRSHLRIEIKTDVGSSFDGGIEGQVMVTLFLDDEVIAFDSDTVSVPRGD